ncbi:MAG: alanyl-tRNA editing protein [Alphaproteobacteria bacterium]|nr:alanyl-tRNA editing protein [Alphaproteobacteria bacterium]
MTEELFREDGYLKTAEAVVRAVRPEGIVLDRTVFYPAGGGQPGDSGFLVRASGARVAIADTRKAPDGILHVPAPDQEAPAEGEKVTIEIDWDRRHRHMRMHTALHLLCAVIPAGVTGGQVGADRSRLDFDPGEVVFDKAHIETEINRLIAEDHKVAPRWVDESELDARPELVRTMSVKPPRGTGRLRLLEIDGVDLQPCGGTHVAHTAEIGRIVVEKIESKGKRNRRVVVALA